MKIIKNNLATIFICLVLIALFATNYTAGTYLIGWDNLMPELNIWMNLKRSIFAVWQEYQGLGLVGGMGHATDFIRQLILLPFTLVLPSSLIRYGWHFAMIALGTLSMNWGLKKVLKFPAWIALCASLFYLLNFGSIQNFWPPFEAFSAFWGFFPLLIFSLISYLNNPSKLSTFKLLTFNFLAIPSFYIQTLFIVYMLCLGIILFSHFIFHRSYFLSHLKTIAIILLLNSFWLLPFAYFLKFEVQNPRLGIGNVIASTETLERNLYRGHISDFLLLRGYYYDFQDDGVNLMAPWTVHFSSQYIVLLGYLLGLLAIVGLVSLFFTKAKKSYLSLSFILIFLLVCIALLSATPPFSYINEFIRSIGLINQTFRSPFTKFITPATFIFSTLTAYGLKALFDLFKSLKYSPQIIASVFVTLYCLTLAIFSYPVFNGNYIYPQMRQIIPTQYFNLINYFKTLPSTARIANLPQGDYWGWTTYRWDARGSGFLWYGIEQPILDRAFDVWNLKNEDYYWELSYALQKQDQNLFLSVLQKYNIQYLIFDDNVIFPGQRPFTKTALSTRELLSQMPELKPIANFDKITVYQTPYSTKPYLSDSTKINSILPSIFTNRTPLSSPPLAVSSTIPSDNFKPATFSNTMGYHLYSFNFSSAPLNQNYLVKIRTRHLAGYPLIVGLYGNDSRYRFTTTRLDYTDNNWHDAWFYLPAMQSDNFDNGITIVFNNASFTNESSVNQVDALELYPVDAPIQTAVAPPTTITLMSQSSIFFYKINLPLNTKNLEFLVLPQSYENGWLAFYFQGIKPIFLTDHHLANNWSNAWALPSNASHLPSTIYSIFWPQLLEFLGFGLLLFVPIVIKKL